MPAARLAAVLLAFLCCLGRGAHAACDVAYASPGPHAVGVVDATWTDAARNRAVPVRIYVPGNTAAGKRPAIIFSHGLGGSRAGGEAWGRHWASHGFVSIHLQHAGSDDALWRNRGATPLQEAMLKGFTAQAYVDRLADVRFVVDEIARRAQAGDAVAARIDLAHLGMSGHSFGARTTQVVMGERLPLLGVGDRYADPRFVAAIAFSPSASGPAFGWASHFGGMTRPMLSITGTRDGDPFGSAMPASQRTEVFRNMPPPGKYLLVLEGANHLVFDGGRATSGDTDIERCVRMTSLAFWKSQLEGDAAATTFLQGPGLAAALGDAGTWQAK